jgi:TRAP-type C4-dicarboxylate transport system substrate-binding protein
MSRSLVAAVLCLCWSAAPCAEVTLRAITSLPSGHAINAQFHTLMKEVNARGKGGVQIQYIGGPEAMPVAEQLTALQRGVADLYFGPASYFDGQVPETGALNASNRSAPELRSSGALALLNKAYNAKANAEYLGYFSSSVTFHIYLRNEPRRTPAGGVSFEGMKLRGAPVFRTFYESLGATLVVVQAPEIYSALERGLVDGIGWTALGLADNGWERLLKIRIFPTFWQGDLSLLGNRASLQKLDPAARALLQETIIAVERNTDAWGDGERRKQEAKMAAAGMKDLRLEGAEAAKYYAAAYGSLWTALEKRLPKNEVDALRKAFFKE